MPPRLQFKRNELPLNRTAGVSDVIEAIPSNQRDLKVFYRPIIRIIMIIIVLFGGRSVDCMLDIVRDGGGVREH